LLSERELFNGVVDCLLPKSQASRVLVSVEYVFDWRVTVEVKFTDGSVKLSAQLG
jgi:hypothetical protein